MTDDRRFLLGGELSVHRLGYGAMRLSGQPGNFGPYADWEGGKALLRSAIDLGIDFIDTAHSYGAGHNETLIAEALHPYPAGVVIATKGGIGKRSASEFYVDGSPARLRAHLEESLRVLRVERIDLYQLHRPDPDVPFADTVGALAEMRAEGKIRLVGLSNITVDQLREALAITPIASVQNRFNRNEADDGGMVAFCRDHGIAFLPYGPLGGQPLEAGSPLADTPNSIQDALRWLLEHSPNIIAIPGTTSAKHLAENMAAWPAGKPA